MEKNELSLEEMQLIENAAKVLFCMPWSEKDVLEYFKIVFSAVRFNSAKQALETLAQDVIDRDAALTRLHEGLIEALEENSQLVEESK